MAEVVTYELEGPVAWVTIRRPEKRNALNAEVRSKLWEATHRFNADAQAKVLVLTGEGTKAFSAGADLQEMAATQMVVPPLDFFPMFGRNVEVPKPTIAAVNGAAMAGGFALAQYCDLCIASTTASFAISEVTVGRGAPWAAPLLQLVPRRIALELLLLGRPMSAARAYDVGLVNEVVEPGQLVERTQAVALQLAGNAPLSVQAGKAMVAALDDTSSAAAFELAEALWDPVYRSSDAQEGPRAFAEQRAPRWSGR